MGGVDAGVGFPQLVLLLCGGASAGLLLAALDLNILAAWPHVSYVWGNAGRIGLWFCSACLVRGPAPGTGPDDGRAKRSNNCCNCRLSRRC